MEIKVNFNGYPESTDEFGIGEYVFASLAQQNEDLYRNALKHLENELQGSLITFDFNRSGQVEISVKPSVSDDLKQKIRDAIPKQ